MGFYKRINLGGVKDRKLDHNGFTSIIFSYASMDDVNANKIIKITDLSEKLDNNAILFYSNSETKRMSNVAKEQIEAVYNAFKNKDNDVLLKIALKWTDSADDYEHIWFKLLEIFNGKFKCELTQEPYNVKDIKVGDIRDFTVDDITDWVIYTKEGTISPNNAYIAIDK